MDHRADRRRRAPEWITQPCRPRKHQVSDDDMLHAYRHPIRVFDVEDLDMLIGADTVGRMLEVGVAESEGIEFIVHAMPARAKFLES